MSIISVQAVQYVLIILLAVPATMSIFASWALHRRPLLRRITLGIFCVYFLCLTGSLAWRHWVPTQIHQRGCWASWPNDLAELENDARYILSGRMLKTTGESLFFLQSPRWYQADIGHGHTLSLFQVGQVFKGTLPPDSVITVREPYYHDRDILRAYMVSLEMYLPMKRGGHYILFLDDDFRVIYAHLGKHVIHAWPDHQDVSPRRMEIFSGLTPGSQELDQYTRIHRQVQSKYGDPPGKR